MIASQRDSEVVSHESDRPECRPTESDTPTTSSPADPQQIAAEDYPWLYMNSTLDACFEDETPSKSKLATSVQTGDDTEEKVKISFHDETAADQFAKTAPEVMHAFISHGEACTQMDTEALQVASQEPESENSEDYDAPIQVYNDLLSRIDSLLEEAHSLKTSILELTLPSNMTSTSPKDSAGTPRSQILPMFTACLPVLHARVDNLTIAQQLVEGAKENYAMNLQMELLGLDDSDSEDDT